MALLVHELTQLCRQNILPVLEMQNELWRGVPERGGLCELAIFWAKLNHRGRASNGAA